MDAGIAHGVERVEAVLVGARRDDGAVIFRRGVEVVVVVVEAGGLQPRRLLGRQHAERGAGLEPQGLDALHHGADGIEIALLRAAPCRAHAEARGAAGFRRTRLAEHRVEAHKFLGLDAGVVLRGLRTIGAILRAAAGLDRQQGRDLHFGRIEILPVRQRRAEHQLRKRQREQCAHLLARPVVAERVRSRARPSIVSK